MVHSLVDFLNPEPLYLSNYTPKAGGPMGNPIRVLLVDDEERFVQNLAKLLSGRGFDVTTASDGEAGVAAVEESDGFDVVLLDVKMPRMDGIEALRKIKETAPDTEVIMLTGHANVETGIEAMREGALDYLMKPCDIEDLVAKINEAHEIEDIRRRPVLWPRRVVKEITWPSFIRLDVDDSLEKALGVFMREPGMSARDELYVLDAEDRFQGVVTRRDLLEAAQRQHPERSIAWANLIGHPEWLPAAALRSIMRPGHPVTTDPEADLAEVARRMLDNKARCMPVLEDGRVTGIVRLNDVLQHLAR
jgi:two-component system, NtrC family, response regulator HydG